MAYNSYLLKANQIQTVYRPEITKKSQVSISITNSTGNPCDFSLAISKKRLVCLGPEDFKYYNTPLSSDTHPLELTGLTVGPNEYIYVKSSIDNLRVAVQALTSPISGCIATRVNPDCIGLTEDQESNVHPGVSFSYDNLDLPVSLDLGKPTNLILDLESSFGASDTLDITFRLTTGGYKASLSRSAGSITLTRLPDLVGLYSLTGLNLVNTNQIQLGLIDSAIRLDLNGTLVMDLLDSSYSSGDLSISGSAQVTSLQLINLDDPLASITRASTARVVGSTISTNSLKVQGTQGFIEEAITNLVINSSFSNWSSTVPDNWSTWTSNSVVSSTANSFGPVNPTVLITDNNNSAYTGAIYQHQTQLLTSGQVISFTAMYKPVSGNPKLEFQLAGPIEAATAYLRVSGMSPTVTSSGLDLLESKITDLGSGWFEIKAYCLTNQDTSFVRPVLFGKTLITDTGSAGFANIQYTLRAGLFTYQPQATQSDLVSISNQGRLSTNRGSVWVDLDLFTHNKSTGNIRPILDAGFLSISQQDRQLNISLGSASISYTVTTSGLLGVVWSPEKLSLYLGSSLVQEVLRPSELLSTSTIYIGSNSSGTLFLNGAIRKLQLSNLELTSLNSQANSSHSFYWDFSNPQPRLQGSFVSPVLDLTYSSSAVALIDKISSQASTSYLSIDNNPDNLGAFQSTNQDTGRYARVRVDLVSTNQSNKLSHVMLVPFKLATNS